MPIPIEAAQASLTINGVVYEMRDVHVRQDDSIELDRVTYDGGRTLGRARGRITSRVVIEAEVFPEPITTLDPRLSPADIDQLFLERVGLTRHQAGLTGQRRMLEQATQAAINEPIVHCYHGIDSGTCDACVELRSRLASDEKPQPPPGPEPRSVWDRLIDESEC
jgi:hypothetical protein